MAYSSAYYWLQIGKYIHSSMAVTRYDNIIVNLTIEGKKPIWASNISYMVEIFGKQKIWTLKNTGFPQSGKVMEKYVVMESHGK